ncbi:DMT family transporter [Rhodovulum sulfidophilum]|uniref:DMT family transporter n=1 Tax=Rhodovulum sulfidophilum TaxID=35806 RepID=UPI00192381B9|nr:DMT family transporter [Rhodovulum sulfidophilum]MBL3574684.1 DMT family transporter [Rhodovulum sulfidophilum]MCE8430223.1 DMT family transporter [Rhodovulum sulfidophilum]MCF4115533.1 DMT family transporter [Rhodovulum sulfidophilum]
MTGTAATVAGRDPMAGIAAMCAGVACLCVNDAFAKALTEGYSPVQILFLRSLIALPFAAVIAVGTGGPRALVSRRPLAHLARGGLVIVAALMFFTSFRYLGLAEATGLIFVAPIFITALSALVLREPVGWRRWLAVAAGFAGVLIVVRPGAAAFQPASVLPVLAALFYAVLMLSARWLDARESVWTMQLWLVGSSVLLSGLAVGFVWTPVPAGDLWAFACIALFGTLGMTLITQAFRMAPAVVIAPLDYTALLWATGFGWLFWQEVPDRATAVGAAVIVASGVFIMIRERRAAG